jgi:predicted phage replisome organizer
MSQKRYFWLKLRDNFFNTKEIKLIRKLPSGSDILIVLLKLQVAALKTGGLIEIDGICDTVEEEISLIIDEELSVVKISLAVLKKFHLISDTKESDIEVLLHEESIGSENASTMRVRQHRAKKKRQNQQQEKLYISNNSGNNALHCNADVTKVKRLGNAETETEIEIEKEKNKLTNKKDDLKDQLVGNSFSYFAEISNQKEIDPTEEAIKDLQSLGLSNSQIKAVIRTQPIDIVEQAVIETFQAKLDRKINERASQYFYGVLRNLSSEKKLA